LIQKLLLRLGLGGVLFLKPKEHVMAKKVVIQNLSGSKEECEKNSSVYLAEG
jgi:hypothetical protein